MPHKNYLLQDSKNKIEIRGQYHIRIEAPGTSIGGMSHLS